MFSCHAIIYLFLLPILKCLTTFGDHECGKIIFYQLICQTTTVFGPLHTQQTTQKTANCNYLSTQWRACLIHCQVSHNALGDNNIAYTTVIA
jgi:hypothetical protein